ncbi:MAG: hypothetical protein QOH11_838, partial [Solirubrobacteraceae bacterium]|nr:hypothetical protein [Solirubrobacteraceae bacterium]
RDIAASGPDLLTIAPLVAVILALGVYPQVVLSRLDAGKPPAAAADQTAFRGWTTYAPLPGNTP